MAEKNIPDFIKYGKTTLLAAALAKIKGDVNFEGIDPKTGKASLITLFPCSYGSDDNKSRLCVLFYSQFFL